MLKKYLSNQKLLKLVLPTILVIAGLVFFSKPDLRVTVSSYCSIDQVLDIGNNDTNFSVKVDSTFYVSGWMANPIAGEVPNAVSVVITDTDGNIVQSQKGAVDKGRPDVADYFKNQSLINSGYRIEVKPISNIGDHQIQVVANFDDNLSACSIVRLLKVGNV